MSSVAFPILVLLGQGLVGYWPLNEGKGVVAHDRSGNGFHGRIHNGSWWVDEKGNAALEFNGRNTYVEVPHHEGLNFSKEFTLMAWAYPLGLDWMMSIVNKGREHFASGYGMGIMVDNDPAKRGRGWPFISAATERRPGKGVQGPCQWFEARKARILPRRWYHLACTYSVSKNEVAFFVNGELVGRSEAGGEVWYLYPRLRLVIGAMAFAPSYWQFKGFIREVKVYNRALSPGEVREEFERTRHISELRPIPSEERQILSLPYIIKGKVVDEASGKPVPARVYVKNAKGRPFFPHPSACSRWLSYLGRGFFYALEGDFEVRVPPGEVEIWALKGFEYEPARLLIRLKKGERKEVVLALERLVNLQKRGWFSGDEELQTFGHGQREYDKWLNGPNRLLACRICQAEGLNWANFVDAWRGRDWKYFLFTWT